MRHIVSALILSLALTPMLLAQGQNAPPAPVDPPPAEAVVVVVAEDPVEPDDSITDAWTALLAARDTHSSGQGDLDTAMDTEARELGEYEAAQLKTEGVRNGQSAAEGDFHDAVRSVIAVLQGLLPVGG